MILHRNRPAMVLLAAMILSAIWLPSGSRAATFELRRCEKFTDVGAFLQLAAAGQTRTLIINPRANLVVFKGTSGEDPRWTMRLDAVEALSFDRELVLTIEFKKRDRMVLGRIDAACLALLRSELAAVVEIREGE